MRPTLGVRWHDTAFPQGDMSPFTQSADTCPPKLGERRGMSAHTKSGLERSILRSKMHLNNTRQATQRCPNRRVAFCTETEVPMSSKTDREILNQLLEKYAADGELQISLPDILKLPPISYYGNVNEITQEFGGPDRLRTAVNQLQALLSASLATESIVSYLPAS